MNVQFGRWNLDGKPIDRAYLNKVHSAVFPFGPDGGAYYSRDNVVIGYRGFHTTKESHRERQPHATPSGAVITWDGRLDNRSDLASQLRLVPAESSTDRDIVVAAYRAWDTNCFAKLIGDWAVSIWDPTHRSLLLAKDPIGTRHLYYFFDTQQIVWSTVLDPLVRLADKTFAVNEEYIAGWLSFFPAAQLTPYVTIHSVPPSSYVLLSPGKRIISKYWDFDPGKKIRYRTDAEYEEHFRTVFATAVQRRLRSDRPVLAELSGGIDSSSIVCMADTLIAQGRAVTSHIDTISWYRDSSDANDDHPYFMSVEKKRGRTGEHINLTHLESADSADPLVAYFDNQHFAATPAPNVPHAKLYTRYSAYMKAHGHRVVLSGQAGEEATGGNAPTATPELQELLKTARLFSLNRQLEAWAKKGKTSKFRLLQNAVEAFLRPVSPVGSPRQVTLAPWFVPDFVHRNHVALRGYPTRVTLFGPSPSFQDHMSKLNGIVRRALAYYSPRRELLRELRYPYLDRDLLEFMFAIPCDQIVRAGQSRSLMKRALIGIVPDEILNRTKPLVRRRRAKDDFAECAKRFSTDQPFICSSIGIVDANRLIEAVEKARRREPVLVRPLLRTFVLEAWLRHLTLHGILAGNGCETHSRNCAGDTRRQLPVQFAGNRAHSPEERHDAMRQPGTAL